MSVLTPDPILKFILTRLRTTYVLPSLFDDADVLTLLNDGYREVCENSGCLRSLWTLNLVAGQREYPLPDDFSGLLYVCCGGTQLNPVPVDVGLLPTGRFGYYVWGNNLGVVPIIEANQLTGVLMALYAAVPSPLATFDDDLDPRFPIEYADILVHYVRWRTMLIAGGAEKIQQAQLERTFFDNRMKELRRQVERVEDITPLRMRHVSDRSVLAR